jgi:putative ABC transport system ATP-binding protein
MGVEILRLLRAMCDHRNVTIVMVTHDQNAAGVADRTITLRDGVIVG